MTTTFVFCDLVGSTALLTELGPAEGEELRKQIFVALREAVEAHHGTEVKSTGDGLMATFASVSDAARGAVALQQGAARLARRRAGAGASGAGVALRVGMSHGDASVEDGDYYGASVVEAARLCDAASAGEILVSDLVRALVGSRSELGFGQARSYELKGLGEVSAVSLEWSEAGAASEVPAALRVEETAIFVGRAPELDVLRSAWKEAAAGARRAVLLGGEPGIGKTTLAARAADHAHEQGATVLFGRCDEGMGVPYQPFVEALGAVAAAPDNEVWAGFSARELASMSRLLPGLGDGVADELVVSAVDPETERYQLFESVVDLLATLGTQAPVVMVLDDLQWASVPTLLLLRHVLRAERLGSLLVIGTYRDTELGRAHPLAETLADLRRLPGMERVSLRGLDAEAVAGFVDEAAAGDVDDRAASLVQVLHTATQGNPLFLSEVLAHLVESGTVYQDAQGRWTADADLDPDELALPEGVREAIGRRLSRLSDAANRALSVASVMGANFRAPVLERVTASLGDSAPVDTVLFDALDEAAAAGLLVSTPDGFAFSHALVRQTLYGELTVARRARLHRRVGEALEAGADTRAHPEALAHHFAEAGIDGGVDKAADYAVAAAQQALDRFAPEEAIAAAERGLSVLELAEPVDRARRCELLLAVAGAQSLRGDGAKMKAAGFAAAEDARALGSPVLLARAAIEAMWTEIGVPDPAAAHLAEEALALLGEHHPGWKVRVLAHWAIYLSATEGDMAGADRESQEAFALAATLDDPAAMVIAGNARMTALDGTPRLQERLDLGAVVAEYAEATGSAALRSQVLAGRACNELAMGDLAGYHRDRLPLHRRTSPGWDRILDALLVGRFPEAREVLAAPLGDSPNYLNAYAAQLFQFHRDLGTTSELIPLLEFATAETPRLMALRAALANAYAGTGQFDEARRHLDVLAAADFAQFPRNVYWPPSLAVLSETAALLGARGHAAALFELFHPWSGQVVVVQSEVVVVGAVDRFLGMLAATLDDLDGAKHFYEAALVLEAGLESTPLLCHTRLWYAKALCAGTDPADRIRARDLLDLTRSDAGALGMLGIVAEAEALTSTLEPLDSA